MFKIDSTEELEFIRTKVSTRQLDYNEQELLCLTQVYKEIGKHYGQNYSLNKSCSSCIKEAMNIVYNYVTFLEEKEQPIPTKKANVTTVQTNLEDLTLKQLRELYPDIKSTSKKGFIKQI